MAEITVYGQPYCADCIRAKRLLTERGVAFDWADVEADADALATMLALQDGGERTPTIVFVDGSILVEPSNAELAAKLGALTAP